jgi:hypothetical protein
MGELKTLRGKHERIDGVTSIPVGQAFLVVVIGSRFCTVGFGPPTGCV